MTNEVIIASGRSHSIASLSAATCFAVVSIYSRDPALLWTAAGAFVGVVLTPDLDQNGLIIADYFVHTIPRFGSAVGKIWLWYSWLYRWLFSHRSFWTHFPFVGTVIRAAYFLWPLYYFGWQLPPAFLNGLVTVDAIHWFMDARLLRRIFTQ